VSVSLRPFGALDEPKSKDDDEKKKPDDKKPPKANNNNNKVHHLDIGQRGHPVVQTVGGGVLGVGVAVVGGAALMSEGTKDGLALGALVGGPVGMAVGGVVGAALGGMAWLILK
jgi:hypothetical protein